MTQNEFNVVLEQQYRKCADMLAHKKKEYTGDRIDRLNAFKIAASLQGCTPKAALAGMRDEGADKILDYYRASKGAFLCIQKNKRILHYGYIIKQSL